MVLGILFFFLLLFGHCLADYPLQGDFMAQAKNRNTEIGKDIWWMVLPSHGLIHAGMVYLATMLALSGPMGLAAATGIGLIFAGIELPLHTAVDFLKCNNEITYAEDQFLHVAFKAVYAGIIGAVWATL